MPLVMEVRGKRYYGKYNDGTYTVEILHINMKRDFFRKPPGYKIQIIRNLKKNHTTLFKEWNYYFTV